MSGSTKRTRKRPTRQSHIARKKALSLRLMYLAKSSHYSWILLIYWQHVKWFISININLLLLPVALQPIVWVLASSTTFHYFPSIVHRCLLPDCQYAHSTEIFLHTFDPCVSWSASRACESCGVQPQSTLRLCCSPFSLGCPAHLSRCALTNWTMVFFSILTIIVPHWPIDLLQNLCLDSLCINIKAERIENREVTLFT